VVAEDPGEGTVRIHAGGDQGVPAEGQIFLYFLVTPDGDALGDQDPGVAVAQKMSQFVGSGHDIDGYGHGAQLLGREVGDDEFRTVGKHQGDLVTPADPQAAQVMSQGVGGAVELRKRHPAFFMDDGHIAGIFVRGLLYHPSQVHNCLCAPLYHC